MVEDKTEEKMETEKIEAKVETKPEVKTETKEEKADEAKTDEKKVEKKPARKAKIEVKDMAIAKGQSLRVSGKHCFAICKMLKNKTPEMAVEILEGVAKLKKPVPMPGREVPHQKGPGIAGAKFPKKAAGEIIPVVKQLAANAIVNGVENPVIVIAKADKAAAPFRRGGRRGKRTHIYLEARDRTKLVKKKRKKINKKTKRGKKK
jgi:ribosomal protein L22